MEKVFMSNVATLSISEHDGLLSKV